MPHQNLWHVANTVLGGKFITQIIYNREERFQLQIVSILRNWKDKGKLNLKKPKKAIKNRNQWNREQKNRDYQ